MLYFRKVSEVEIGTFNKDFSRINTNSYKWDFANENGRSILPFTVADSAYEIAKIIKDVLIKVIEHRTFDYNKIDDEYYNLVINWISSLNWSFLIPENTIGINTSNNLLSQFRPLLDSNAKGIAIIEDYEKKVKTAIKALSAEPPKVVKVNRKNGKEYTYTMSARNRAEFAAK